MGITTSPGVSAKKRPWRVTFKKQWQLYLMSFPMLFYLLLFAYVPLLGWVMAFQEFRPRFGLSPIGQVMSNKWVGLENFKTLLDNSTILGQRFLQSVVNTLGQSLLILVLGFFLTIMLSLLLNELRQTGVKRFVQNVLYLPHFLSWVIVAMLASTALSLPGSGGFLNDFLMKVHIIDRPIQFLADPGYFWGIVAGTHLWKNLGWNTIIYMAAMTSIDPNLYEAASIDGANRYQKMWHVTLASIRPTIVLLLIINIGMLLTSGFEIQWLLGQGVNIVRSENIDVFVLRYGIKMGNFSLATAAGILRTVVSIILLTGSNFVARSLKQETLF
ncbi:MAG: sugar ABC transporter permease [Spirochaetales bacterium]|nr:sugar ABC transporter permease [Spirochaetales bacterium]